MLLPIVKHSVLRSFEIRKRRRGIQTFDSQSAPKIGDLESTSLTLDSEPSASDQAIN